jgi:ribosomal-protein-alanine N-acetyltransferase
MHHGKVGSLLIFIFYPDYIIAMKSDQDCPGVPGTAIEIRRARTADVPAMSAIERESFSDPWDPEILADTITYFPTTIFVATAGGHIAGFIAGGLENTGEEIYGHICNLAVSRSFRRYGIGRHLVAREEHQFAAELASGVQLEVRQSNRAAQTFYQRLGYREVFRIAGYYANGEDAIVMMKWFRF